jgi:hypothetical protein
VKITTDLHLVLRLSGSIPVLPHILGWLARGQVNNNNNNNNNRYVGFTLSTDHEDPKGE